MIQLADASAWARALRGLLDMYSPRWPQRLAVFSLIAVGGGLIAAGHLQGILAFVLLVWANQGPFFQSVDARLRRRPFLVLAPALVVIGARMVSPLPAASDDLLRHVVSGFWLGGYADMYVHASLPPYDLYPAFDWTMGFLATRIGALPTMWLTQAVAWGAFLGVFLGAARRVLPRAEDRAFWLLAALLLTLSAVSIRLTLARPEVFMAIWTLAAVLPRTARGAVGWAGLGVFLGSGYWLAPVYFPAVLLLSAFGWRTRILLLAAMVVVWYALWYGITGAHPAQGLAWLSQALANRSATISVGENASAVNLLALPGVVLLVGAAVWATARPERDLRLLALAGYFLLADQARYVLPAAPLLALYVLSAVHDPRLSWSPAARAGALLASLMLAPACVADVPRLHQLPRFVLPTGSVVLTGFTHATYAVPFHNPGTVRVAPAFEIGASEPWVQHLAGGITRGDLDCADLDGRGFTHVVEKSLRTLSPPCLELAAVNGEWRLWSVRR